MTLRCCLFLVCIVVLGACNSRPPAGGNPDSDLVNLYAQLLLLNEEYKSPSSTLTVEEFHRKTDSILTAHNTTKEGFIARVQGFSSNQESFRLFYDEVTKSVQELNKRQ